MKSSTILAIKGTSLVLGIGLGCAGLGGLSFAITKNINNTNNPNREAVIINDDTSFSQTIDYNATVIPGSILTQEIKVESRIDEKVKCEFAFSSDDPSKYSALKTAVIIGEDKYDEDALSSIMNNKRSYQFKLDKKEVKVIAINYSLPFEYQEAIIFWDFSITIKAEGKLL